MWPDVLFLFRCRLLHDLLHAEFVHGSFDNCLFTLNKPHHHYHPFRRILEEEEREKRSDSEQWKVMECRVQVQTTSFFRPSCHHWCLKKKQQPTNVPVWLVSLKGLNIDHISESTSGPLNWITSGFIDLNLYLLLPPYCRTVAESPKQGTPGYREGLRVPPNPLDSLEMDFHLTLANLSASVPLSTPHLSCNYIPMYIYLVCVCVWERERESAQWVYDGVCISSVWRCVSEWVRCVCVCEWVACVCVRERERE